MTPQTKETEATVTKTAEILKEGALRAGATPSEAMEVAMKEATLAIVSDRENPDTK